MNAKVPKEISAQDATLLKPRRLVDWFEVEHRGVDLFARVRAQDYLWQQRNLYVFGHTGRAENPHSILLNESNRVVELGGPLRKHAHGCAGIDDEIQRLLDSFNCHLAAEKTARRRAYRNVNSGTGDAWVTSRQRSPPTAVSRFKPFRGFTNVILRLP